MNQRPTAAGPIVWWVVWMAFLSGIVVMYFVLGATPREAAGGASSALWAVGLVPVVIAMVIRWVVLTKQMRAAAAFPLFVVGIALCESALFIGLFLFPDQKLLLFVASLVGMSQFAPYFAHHYAA